jgi:DNA processing protein
MKEHGTAQAALAALPEVAKAAGVDKYEVCPDGVARAEMRAAQKAGARMICIGDSLYPPDLAEISDAPPILWAIGDTDILHRPLVAMVGARNASSLGQRMAKGLAADLASKGFAVVSGMARGVDTAAHTSTLDTGTVAVLAGGVDVMYPAENARLAEDITKTGLRLSEQPMGMVPQARHFPRRNRIISGLCRATIVVEAAAKSGSLITARTALDQGREVLAVPGHPFDARASGCNMLIRDGAHLARNAEDVIEVIGAEQATVQGPEKQSEMPLGPIPQRAPPKRSLQDTAALHQQILDRLGPSPVAEDQLIRDLNAPAANVSPVLTDLEIDGRIRRHAGGLLSLAVPKAG